MFSLHLNRFFSLLSGVGVGAVPDTFKELVYSGDHVAPGVWPGAGSIVLIENMKFFPLRSEV